jgi:hypothetical protein
MAAAYGDFRRESPKAKKQRPITNRAKLPLGWTIDSQSEKEDSVIESSVIMFPAAPATIQNPE